MNKIARRMADIQPFHVMEILKRAHQLEAAGRDIIHLEVGEAGFPHSAHHRRGGRDFLAGGHVHYTPALGLTALREASPVSTTTAWRRRLPERIIVTPGASGALMLALAVTTDPGDEWLLPDPATPPTVTWCAASEGVARACRWTPATRFQPTPPTLPTPGRRTRGLMVASPANPTGTPSEPG